MPRNLYKRGGTWWFQKRYKGKRYRFSLETSSLRDAQARYTIKIAELEATHWGEKPKRSFDDAAEKFVAEHVANLRPKSIDRYMTSLRWLSEAFAGVKLPDITSGRLYEFEMTRYRGGVAKSTIRRDLACLSSLMSSAQGWEWIEINPVPSYLKARSKKGLKEGAARTRYLSHAEEERLIAAAPRWLAEMIAFAIDTGLRKEEQFSLQRTHVDFARREIKVAAEIAKSGKSRNVPLLEGTLALLRNRSVLRLSPYIFTNNRGIRYSPRSNYILKALKAAAKRAGIDDLTWHDLRRTCGCRLLQDYHLSMQQVRDWLGHSSVVVTEKSYAFLHVDALHEAIEDGATIQPQRVVNFRRNLSETRI